MLGLMHRHRWTTLSDGRPVGHHTALYCESCPAIGVEQYDGMESYSTRRAKVVPMDDLRQIHALLPEHLGYDLPRYLEARVVIR
jgi:hypothetical protein